MGHIRLTKLPASRPWTAVVELLTQDAVPEEVISASAIAAERSFERMDDNPVFREALILLIEVPRAAASGDFVDGLWRLGLVIAPGPGAVELISGSLRRLDDIARSAPNRNDLGELASRAFSETLTHAIGDRLPGLFVAETEDVRHAAATLANPGAFRDLARAYFVNLCGAILSYWLDRTLATHVGQGKRFRTVADRSAFDRALRQYCGEATRIIDEFSVG